MQKIAPADVQRPFQLATEIITALWDHALVIILQDTIET